MVMNVGSGKTSFGAAATNGTNKDGHAGGPQQDLAHIPLPDLCQRLETSPDVRCAALASRAEDNDTIDLAVIGGLKNDQALNGYQVLHFKPFDPVHKRTEATVKGEDGKQFFVAKGCRK